MAQRWIHRFEIKPGRWVYHPTEEAKVRGQEVKALVERAWRPPRYFFHLRSGGHMAALRHHVNSKFFIRADIENFFGCVTRSKVTRCLVDLLGYREARNIALDSTVRQPSAKHAHLPYGFVQSPLLASLALHKSALGSMMNRIQKNSADLRISVYVDDVIVSGADEIVLAEVLEELVAAGVRSRFPFSPHKVEGPGDRVTAFNIRVSTGLFELTPARLQIFQQEFQESDNEPKKQGIRRYIESINPSQVATLKSVRS